ncbi:hypothetical protein [Aeromonas salmonicida]|uniref:hypothetical protein n=1 Tax=Aeromonas salmonicida TaxID=645 RepID=UPI003A5C1804
MTRPSKRWCNPSCCSSICRGRGAADPERGTAGLALEDETLIADTLSQTAGYKVRVVSRTRAERARFIKLASINARLRCARASPTRAPPRPASASWKSCWSWSAPSPAWSL